ncbi:type I-E CRISPR-associated protein Cse1/CasA [uncultured Acidaminococcus sp.]|uniref:type I-E CRISPR-associated protein Cse1/CasA n=1 Tax=uncultured Acidaminococcus sp. TaxID=352152 RepID=UPI00260FF6F1|nr:type I-E CRISPR-associated protein Cse1/CasA [uncultured Acidaminococcus sp.]
MNEREFNLVDEPWICVLRKDLQVDTLSLRDVFLHGQDYLDLGGENQPQNFAVLRLLIALAYTIFSRVDENGKAMDIAEITDPDEAADEILRRWGALWENGRFPQELVLQYLEQYHDCFWLFDPERPFGQAPGAVRGTQYGAAKLIGDISEGNNKIRIFSNRAGEEKNTLSYPEAARWLLFINAVDDASGKPKQKGLKSIGPGWVGKLGMIQSVGKNLFETILLNLTFLKDGEELWSKKANPNWEHLPKEGERTEIPVPDNLAELLTLQSRRLLLERENGRVIGYHLLGGDFFDNHGENGAFNEQMTIWKVDKKSESHYFVPQQITPGRQMWRDFGSYFVEEAEEAKHIPGIISWLRTLQEVNLLPTNDTISFRIIAFEYGGGSQNSIINDFSSDTLTLYPELLSEQEIGVQETIEQQIAKCDEAARAVNHLFYNIFLAEGGDPEKRSRKGEMLFYRAVDEPFRKWLLQFRGDLLKEPKQLENAYRDWEQQAKSIANQIGNAEEQRAGVAAFSGRILEDKKRNTREFYSVPRADMWFKLELAKIYPKEGDAK